MRGNGIGSFDSWPVVFFRIPTATIQFPSNNQQECLALIWEVKPIVMGGFYLTQTFSAEVVEDYKKRLWLWSNRCLPTKGHAGNLIIVMVLNGTSFDNGLFWTQTRKCLCESSLTLTTFLYYLLSAEQHVTELTWVFKGNWRC